LNIPEVPPVLNDTQQDQIKAAVKAIPSQTGIELSNWTWKMVREFVKQNFGRILGHSSCVNYLHRLGFVVKRPKKRFLKADPEKRAAFVQFYAALKAVS
jgi:transposase